MIDPLLIVHGGAGNIPEIKVGDKLTGVRRAARRGFDILRNGGSVVDAVQAAVRDMEDDEAFNAGRGSVLNIEGEVEMDAIVMEGQHMTSGAVGAIRNVAHPVDVARLVMEKTPHALLVGDGAKKFANEQGVPNVPMQSLVTENATEALQSFKNNVGPSTTELGTVGAVAIDCKGHLAVATSTGGINGKMVGRVGDTPLPGCGAFADDNVGAVSTTGHGESIMRFCLAHTILNHMAHGKSAKEATEMSCIQMTERVGETAGAITISKHGDVGIGFSSNRMAWAYQRGITLHYGIDKGHDSCEYTN